MEVHAGAEVQVLIITAGLCVHFVCKEVWHSCGKETGWGIIYNRIYLRIRLMLQV